MVVRGDAAGHTAGRGARALGYLHVHQVAPRLHDALCLLPGRSNTSIVNKGGIARTTVPLGSSERQARREECCRRLVRATIGDGRRRDRERAQHVGKRRGRGRLDGAAKLPFRRHKPILGKLPRAASHSHRSGQNAPALHCCDGAPRRQPGDDRAGGFGPPAWAVDRRRDQGYPPERDVVVPSVGQAEDEARGEGSVLDVVGPARRDARRRGRRLHAVLRPDPHPRRQGGRLQDPVVR